jgi:hypothetical protein
MFFKCVAERGMYFELLSHSRLAKNQTARLSMGVKTRRAVLCQADSTEVRIHV